MLDGASIAVAAASGLAGALLGIVAGPFFQNWWSRPRLAVKLLHRQGADATFEVVNRGPRGASIVRAWSVSSPLSLENEVEEGRFYEPRRGMLHQAGVPHPSDDLLEMPVGPFARVEFRAYFPNVMFSTPSASGAIAQAWFQDARGKKYRIPLMDSDKPHRNEGALDAERRQQDVLRQRGILHVNNKGGRRRR